MLAVRPRHENDTEHRKCDVGQPRSKERRELCIAGDSRAPDEGEVVHEHQDQTEDQSHGLAAARRRNAKRQPGEREDQACKRKSEPLMKLDALFELQDSFLLEMDDLE